jgi:hypothetical protein
MKTRLVAISVLSVDLVCGMPLVSIGVVDMLYAERVGPHIRSELEKAAGREPADLDYIIGTLHSPSWQVGLMAAGTIRELAVAGRLSPTEQQRASEALVRVLRGGGRWWRIGWDLEESEYEQFRGEASDALATMGPSALPAVLEALRSGQPAGEMAACGTLARMAQMGTLDAQAISEAGAVDAMNDLAAHSPDWLVAHWCAVDLELLATPTDE